MIELTEIIRQKNTNHLLNFCIDLKLDPRPICCIQYSSISLLDRNYPLNALHIWAENIPVDQPKNAKLAVIPKLMFTDQDIDRVHGRGRSETGGLDYELHLKETARVMLTADIDISNRLINGQILKGYQ